MGLDQYARVRFTKQPKDPVDFSSLEIDEEFFYWRKHPNLHGWMEKLYRAKGGKEEFNVVPVALTLKDLDDLEKAVRLGTLDPTTGFFFGRSTGDEREKATDLEFIAKARELLTKGGFVYYTSWW